MQSKRHSEERIVEILKRVGVGVKAVELCRQHGISERRSFRLPPFLIAGIFLILCQCSGERNKAEKVPFTATAYSIQGVTKSGDETRRGIVAVDPKVIPLGSKIRVYEAGDYSGRYVALDTGKQIKGRRIDIFVEDFKEAKEFGKQSVHVEILSRGEDAN